MAEKDVVQTWARHVPERSGLVAARQPVASGKPTAYHTLLVPLDGTTTAECALPFAVRLATLAGARLLLVRAVPGADEAATRAEAHAYLTALAAPLRSSGLTVETATPQGAPASAITAFAAQAHADLIIAATSGGWLIGRGDDLASALLRRVAIPILLVRDWHKASALVGAPPRTIPPRAQIVVPLDGSATAEQALGPAQHLAALLGSELVLVRAVPAAQPGVPEGWGPASPRWRADCAADAAGYLRGVAARLAVQGVAARCEVRPDSPIAAIHGAVREHDAALLVLATHGETGLATMPLGSVARRVLWEADTPVVLIHPTLPHERTEHIEARHYDGIDALAQLGSV